MNKNLAMALLVVAALAAPAVLVGVEWARTVMGFFNLAPGTPYMPNGFLQFYLIVAGAMLVIAVPSSRSLLRLGELRPTRYIRNALMILIFWKIIDVTMLSGGVPDLNDMGSTLVLSMGTFIYGVIAGLVFWRIAIRPHRSFTAIKMAGDADE
ncbi:MAG: hypothetical protein HOK98_01090 [Rhodospirillaceae bacterium]|jgi:hypothetical protein|nr:hypothetical protein [Rhodospirillaceae bacterium]MBT5945892.1 hypothetical protein [Rhodospirillaceae bacterium]MBT6403170.1 hypothetical protein [Rhodospirillaceae bacterium]MBT6534749.1 hypothetical protein [Rhodospirillaceae bacterium]